MLIHGNTFKEYSNGMQTGRIKEADQLSVAYRDKTFVKFYAISDKEVKDSMGEVRSAEDILDNPWLVLV